MDLNKLKDDQKLDLCRWYFRGERLKTASERCGFRDHKSEKNIFCNLFHNIFKLLILFYSWFCIFTFPVGCKCRVVFLGGLQEKPV